MRPLVWFRSDLRIDDHRALYAACGDATRGVVGVFCICPKQWAEHDWADIKVTFLLRNLQSLRRQLDTLRIPLRIIQSSTFAGIDKKLHDLARALECDALYFNNEYEVNETRRDAVVATRFEKAGFPVRRFTDQIVVPPDSIKTGNGNFYRVFTPFKRAWLTAVSENDALDSVGLPKHQADRPCDSDEIPDRIKGFDVARKLPDEWPAGEPAAGSRLTQFFESRIDGYLKQRDLPAIDGTSRLSPYLTLGVLSPRQCLSAARTANRGRLSDGCNGPDTWINEIIWREFYRHVLVGFPRVSMNRAFKPETEKLRWSDNEAAFAAWCDGRTGVPIVDAAMRQLLAIGWMHNRLRMIVAMYLTKDLFISWRWGERYFMRHLIDGDLASNNGGWQWAASTGTDAAPYFRIFNPYEQSRKFDADGAFIRRYVPELASVEAPMIHDPTKWPPPLRGTLEYPEPICDHAEARKRTVAAFKALK